MASGLSSGCGRLYERKRSRKSSLRRDSGSTAGRVRFPTSPKLDIVPSKVGVGPMNLCCLRTAVASAIVSAAATASVTTNAAADAYSFYHATAVLLLLLQLLFS